MNYVSVTKEKCYRLINTNPLLLISTISIDKEDNIAPIAWICPQEILPPRLLICIDTGHKTFENIKMTKKFIACIPHISQLDLVKKTGNISGHKVDKFAKFNIKYFSGEKVNCKMPYGIIGYLECRLKKIIKIENTAIVIADIILAKINKDVFNGERLLVEKKEGKMIQHLGKNKFITHGDSVLE